MSSIPDLKQAERKAYIAATQDGLTDVFIGAFLMMLAIAPLLSETLGDFWSSAVFLPFWALLWWALHMIRKHVVRPRVGTITFGSKRKKRLTLFTTIMLVLNILVFILGLLAFRNTVVIGGGLVPVYMGIMGLVGFSLAAYFLDYSRFYFYGLLLFFAPFVGEWLFWNGYASHHGFPVVFGFLSAVIIMIGVFVFLRLLKKYPLPEDEMTMGEL